MSHQSKKNIVRDLSNRVGRLSVTELNAYRMLSNELPVIELGTLVIPKSVHSQIPYRCLWFAVEMHQRGYWGAVPDVDFRRNERAMTQGGTTVSFWTFQEMRAFWLRTIVKQGDPTTTAFLDCFTSNGE